MDNFGFITFLSNKRDYKAMDIPYDQKLDFSGSIKAFSHFMKLGNFWNFSKIFGNIFLYIKIDTHTNFYVNSSKIECFIS